ncbi:lysine 2,3-aminomutase, partial [Magnetococcales bacterium HHB-1]
MGHSHYTRSDLDTLSQRYALSPALIEQIRVASAVVPLRVTQTILDRIDWNAVPHDPIFRLLFPDERLFSSKAFAHLKTLIADDKSPSSQLHEQIKKTFNPDPGDQIRNIPQFEGEALLGVQHKYRETVLIFPHEGQSCFSFCTYCFRWEQLNNPHRVHQLTLDNLPRLQRYLKTQPQVTDLVFTGGDPLIMDAATLSAYITPLLKLVHIKNFRIGTKALSYHPDCFLNHTAAPLLTLFKTIMAQG